MVRVPRPGSDRPAVAYAISRKVGTAVVRNRLRRQLRVAASAASAAGVLESGSYLVVVGASAAGTDMTTLCGHLESAAGALRARDVGAAVHGGAVGTGVG